MPARHFSNRVSRWFFSIVPKEASWLFWQLLKMSARYCFIATFRKCALFKGQLRRIRVFMLQQIWIPQGFLHKRLMATQNHPYFILKRNFKRDKFKTRNWAKRSPIRFYWQNFNFMIRWQVHIHSFVYITFICRRDIHFFCLRNYWNKQTHF